MRHLVMKEAQCLLYSAAMALDVDVQDITDILGHDGLEIVRPEIAGNDRYRGVHIQEIQAIAMRYGKMFAVVEAIPARILGDEVIPYYTICGVDYAARFMHAVKGRRGIIVGQANGREHAVAFEDVTIYDPKGMKYQVGCSQLQCREAWILLNITGG